jgi:isoleucyl-tRNA synthetase
MYRNLTGEESVHLSDWPKEEFPEDKGLIEDMANVRMVVEKVHAIRKEKQIPVRMPLGSLVTVAPFDAPSADVIPYLLTELNVKKWTLTKGEVLNNILDTKVTPELEEEAKTRELIRQIQDERKKRGMNLTQRIKVKAPWIPTNAVLAQRLKTKTLATSLEAGEFKITKAS